MLQAQQPDSKPGAYYVSIVRSDGDYRLALGPFVDNHQAALQMVEPVRRKAESLDPRAVWYGFGTVRLDSDSPPAGILNGYFKEALQ